jgi:hypothetical protein
MSRDGLDLVSYLTLPPWKTGDGNRPTSNRATGAEIRMTAGAGIPRTRVDAGA